MNVEELKTEVLALGPEDRKAFIINTLPELSRDLVKDSAFMMQLFPVIMGIVRESGMDIQQLVQLAAMLGGSNYPKN